MRILAIDRVPKWKFWKIDNWEVLVEVGGYIKRISIFLCKDPYPEMLPYYLRNKILTGNQFRKLDSDKIEQLFEFAGKDVEVDP